MNYNSRRNFLKLTAGAAAAGMAFPLTVQGKTNTTRADSSKIIYRELGKTGIKLPKPASSWSQLES